MKLNLNPSMTLHQNKEHTNLDLNALFLLLNTINNCLTKSTVEILTIQRNATMQVISEILAIIHPEEAKNYQTIFFNLQEVFPEKDYCPYSTGSNLKKNIRLNKDLFRLGCSLCHQFNSDKMLKTQQSLSGYLSLHLNGYKQKHCNTQLELAREELRTYKKYKTLLPTSTLELAKRFSENRETFYTLSLKSAILSPFS